MKNIRKLKTMLLVALLGWAGVANAEDWSGTIGYKSYESGTTTTVNVTGPVTLTHTVYVYGTLIINASGANRTLTRGSENTEKLFIVQNGGSLIINGGIYKITIDGNNVENCYPIVSMYHFNCSSVATNTLTATDVTVKNIISREPGGFVQTLSYPNYGSYPERAFDNITLTGCSFNNNAIPTGNAGVILTVNTKGNTTITDCVFSNNSAAGSGGGCGLLEETKITITGCSFTNNVAQSGVAFGIQTEEKCIISNCSFTGNACHLNESGSGGAMTLWFCPDVEITGCNFTNNTAEWAGGAIDSYGSDPVITNCTFTNNQANGSLSGSYAGFGGAIMSRFDEMTIDNCTFTGNYALSSGGAIHTRGGIVTVKNSTITNNNANLNGSSNGDGGLGGGIYIDFKDDNQMTIIDCDIINNTAYTEGGGIYKVGKLTVSGLVHVDNNTKGTSMNSIVSNTYISNYSDPDMQYYVNIHNNGLLCGSHIGITKTAADHTFETDDVYGGVRTDIARGLQTNCDFAFHNRFFFDDTDTYHVHNLVQGSTNPYANAKLYFITSWYSYVPSATVNVDYKADANGFVTEVMTANGLAYFAWHVNQGSDGNGNTYQGKTVKQTADIDLAEHYWEPIGIKQYGDCYDTYMPFKGTYDGQGYVIRNVRSILPYDAMGFFGYVDGGTITRTFIESGSFEATGSRTVGIGGLVGRLLNGATVTYSEARVDISHTAEAVMGGLIGMVDGITASNIHSSMAMSSLTNSGVTGGLVGQLNAGSTLKNSFSNAKYTLTGTPFAGGLVGINAGTVSNCYANDTRNANSIGSEVRFGWLVGQNRGVVEYCFAPNSTNYINDNTEETTTYTNTEPGYFTASESLNGKYKYNQYDQRATGGNTHKPTSGKVNLLGYLNHWVSGDYAQWTRTLASPINTDYPVLELPTFACAGSTDGLFIWYSPSLDAMTTRYNALDGGGSVYLYTPQENVSVNNDSDVNIYIGEDIGLTQTATNTLQSTHVGITLDNDDGSDLGGQNYDWHMFSTPLSNASMGLTYSTEYLGIDNSTWGDNGVWPVDPPTGSLTIGANCYFPGDTPYGPPQTEISPTGGCFDFYCFSEPFYHWVNFKRHSTDHWHQNADNTGNHASLPYGDYNAALTWVDGNETVMIPGKGYMMAVDKETTLINTGTLSNGTVQRKITCSDLESPMSKLKGFNLVGNPFQSYLNFNEFANDNGIDTYYILDANAHGYLAYTTGSTPQPSDWMNGVVGYTASQYIHPHQGFFVHTDEAALTLKFQSDARCASVPTGFTSNYRDEATLYPLINLVCTDAEGMCDYATIELNRPEQGGGRKAKGLHAGDGIIYTRLDSEDYHIAFTECGTQSVNLHFEAFENGIFTLRWNMQNGDFSYLHLIDNLTGSDIDCLVADEYRFEASTHDYTSRFRLVFDFTGVEENDEPAEGSGSFIFQMGDELIVNGEGLLQMFDLNGRCLLSETLHGQQNAVGMPSVSNGVYIMRLTANNQTRTQKMVINK